MCIQTAYTALFISNSIVAIFPWSLIYFVAAFSCFPARTTFANVPRLFAKNARVHSIVSCVLFAQLRVTTFQQSREHVSRLGADKKTIISKSDTASTCCSRCCCQRHYFSRDTRNYRCAHSYVSYFWFSDCGKSVWNFIRRLSQGSFRWLCCRKTEDGRYANIHCI